MKKRYILSRLAQPNGDHEVHELTCKWLPNPENIISLGDHLNCYTAVIQAKQHYNQVNGCKYCCSPCHTQ